MKRRICLLGTALSVLPLAFGVGAATAKTKTPTKKPTVKVLHLACTTNTSIVIALGDTGVTPPTSQGQEYGTSNCESPLGSGVQSDNFTVPDSGDTVATYWWYFHTGAVHGTYDLTPQEGSFNDTNFLEVDWLGTLTVTGGTGEFAGITGTGTMACTTLDGIHTTCNDKLKLKPKPVVTTTATKH